MAGNWFSDVFSNPNFKQFASEGLQDLGYGMANSTDMSGAFGAATQRMGQMQPYRDLATEKRADALKQTEQGNVTRSWLEQQGFTDLVPLVDAGQADIAYSEALKRMQPQAGPDPFTLGAGQIRYDGAGNVIAQGPEGGPETIVNNNIGGSDKFYDTMDAKLAEQTAAVIESGYNAQSNNIRIGELERLLGPGGAPQGAQGVMIQAAGSIGIPVEGLDDLQAAQALISQMVPGQRPAGSGTMSDADLALFKQSLPAIINQPGGNQKVLQTMKAINEYTIQQAAIAQRVANREISPAEGRALQAQVPNPLARTGGGAPSALPNGVTIRRVQ